MIKKESEILPDLGSNQGDKNHLFPVFLKLEELEVLLVGAGKVGLEKLTAVLQNAPASSVTVVASEISPEVKLLADSHPGVILIERSWQ
jgi:siroheme synthase (precorrin-2 oxidase/ferrochelatase)